MDENLSLRESQSRVESPFQLYESSDRIHASYVAETFEQKSRATQLNPPCLEILFGLPNNMALAD